MPEEEAGSEAILEERREWWREGSQGQPLRWREHRREGYILQRLGKMSRWGMDHLRVLL
jgi:hypothetical protein